jgi:hypothetical protein
MFKFSLLLKSKEMGNIKSKINKFIHRVILCGLCVNDVEIAMNNILAIEKELNAPTPPPTPSDVELNSKIGKDASDVETMTS